MDNRFNIAFFEFAFLVEACIPPVPIARATFWKNVIDMYYFKLSKNERYNLFQWINITSKMQASIYEKNEECLLFNARFDPDNQYNVTTNFNNTEDVIECFKLNGKYHVSSKSSVNEKYIINIEKKI